ncbi:hypothetical protein OLZ31_26105 [Enterobacter asburiae]|nr:hypothetical protein [Enterobacter asburiae]
MTEVTVREKSSFTHQPVKQVCVKNITGHTLPIKKKEKGGYYSTASIAVIHYRIPAIKNTAIPNAGRKVRVN